METIITNINDCSEINIYYQDEINLEVDVSLLYIKSGQKEIENYVEHVSKPEINNYIDNYDVVAKHSSVVGQFREQDLFYMLSELFVKFDIVSLH